MVADPMFVDPRSADFLLKPGSPALALGFVPFDNGCDGAPNLRVSAGGDPLACVSQTVRDPPLRVEVKTAREDARPP